VEAASFASVFGKDIADDPTVGRAQEKTKEAVSIE